MIFALLSGDRQLAKDLSVAIREVAETIRLCSRCCNLTQADPCAICTDPHREQTVICVVEHVPDMMAIERAKAYNGQYHILHGALAPMDGVTPEKLKVRELLTRLQQQEVSELILATNPTIEGEATALYLRKLLGSVEGLRITRIATGIPKGGDLEFIDRATLAQALEARREW
jgi:recombination protein RecR